MSDSGGDSVFLAVVGAGPGGYPAAFHAADLGMDVMLVDQRPFPGGVCLYTGCIPSKAILHAAHAIVHSREIEDIGISFGEPTIDLPKLNDWKDGVIHKLVSGLGQLSSQRGIEYVQGRAEFTGPDSIRISQADDTARAVRFEHAIIATGSEPVPLPLLPESSRIMNSSNALKLETLPDNLLVIGGGYIGLELGQAYASLGVEVSAVEAMPFLLPGVDRELVSPLAARLDRQFEKVLLNTKVASATEEKDGILVGFESNERIEDQLYESVLVAVGRRPVTSGLGLDKAGVAVSDNGFIGVDEQRFTSNPAIQAIGDVAGQPMLAHKATHEGRSAVEAINDGKTIYAPRAVPAVIFSDPEISWCGLSEDEARRSGLNVRVGSFPWQASGRAATLARVEGVTRIVVDKDDGTVIGIGIAGANAGEMIAEGVLAIEMGSSAEDLALTIHPHPTLSETIMEAAQRAMGVSSTHYFQRQ